MTEGRQTKVVEVWRQTLTIRDITAANKEEDERRAAARANGSLRPMPPLLPQVAAAMEEESVVKSRLLALGAPTRAVNAVMSCWHPSTDGWLRSQYPYARWNTVAQLKEFVALPEIRRVVGLGAKGIRDLSKVLSALEPAPPTSLGSCTTVKSGSPANGRGRMTERTVSKPDYSVPCVAAKREDLWDAVWCLTHNQYMRHCEARSPLDRRPLYSERRYGAIVRAVHERLTAQGKA